MPNNINCRSAQKNDRCTRKIFPALENGQFMKGIDKVMSCVNECVRPLAPANLQFADKQRENTRSKKLELKKNSPEFQQYS